jgi:hypothetical protein
LLQRALVDFGSDDSFEKACKKVKEHYGVDIASSTTRLDVEKHAKIMHEMVDNNALIVVPKNEATVVIGETDGCMIPVVTAKDAIDNSNDQRKNKTHEWKEARLALARAKGSVDPVYAATVGSVDDAGARLAEVVKSAGECERTKIHCLGDGATWIAEQVEILFGSKATFLLDFFHASDYLALAAACCNPRKPRDWMHEQQELLKNNMAHKVLQNIQNHLHFCAAKETCPGIKCLNYLSKRLHQLDYKGALDAGLPIGSGEIESGHRSVIQARLKIPGAWWDIDNAEDMLALRTIRANGLWGKYWTAVQPSSRMQAYG